MWFFHGSFRSPNWNAENEEGTIMSPRIQELAGKLNMPLDHFLGEMRKLGCSEPTAMRIWRGTYDDFEDLDDNDVHLSNLRKAARVLSVMTADILTK